MWFLFVVFMSHPTEPLTYNYPEGYPHPFVSQAACDAQAVIEKQALKAHPKNQDGKSEIQIDCVQDQKLEEAVNKIILNKRVA